MPNEPAAAMTIATAVRHAVEAFAHRIVVVDGDPRVTYEQLGADVVEAGAALVARGIERGDRVAIWAPNSYEWIVACLATGMSERSWYRSTRGTEAPRPSTW